MERMNEMTLEQQAINIITSLPTDKLTQVINFAKFLLTEDNDSMTIDKEEKFIRQPGLLKGQIKMSADFNETPECFKEYM